MQRITYSEDGSGNVIIYGLPKDKIAEVISAIYDTLHKEDVSYKTIPKWKAEKILNCRVEC